MTYFDISIHALREEGDPSALPLITELRKFLSTPSARRATCWPPPPCLRPVISIHALREEGDKTIASFRRNVLDFYPRPPRGGRHGRAGGVLLLDLFLSTPSARRATFVLPDGWEVDPYFYPRPPRGGRRAGIAPCGHCSEYFYPRPPRGGRLDVLVVLKVVAKFLSTPSARRATSFSFLPAPFIAISIHALREEGDTRSDDQEAHLYISIHALREEGDRCRLSLLPAPVRDFYPRPPRGGRRSGISVMSTQL